MSNTPDPRWQTILALLDSNRLTDEEYKAIHHLIRENDSLFRTTQFRPMETAPRHKGQAILISLTSTVEELPEILREWAGRTIMCTADDKLPGWVTHNPGPTCLYIPPSIVRGWRPV